MRVRITVDVSPMTCPAETETAPRPRRPARAWTPWPRWLKHRYFVRTLALAALVAVAVPAWGWIDHSIRAAEAYSEGRINAKKAITGGYLILDGPVDPAWEVFVDPRTGLQTSEPMMCCVVEEFDMERRQGFDHEVERAFQAGELASLDLRPKLRSEAEVLALFETHGDDVFVMDEAGGSHEGLSGGYALTWTEQTEGAPWAHLTATAQDDPVRVTPTIIQAPARGLLVDDGSTLLVIESTTAVQVLDLDRRARLAWYGGWMSRTPRR